MRFGKPTFLFAIAATSICLNFQMAQAQLPGDIAGQAKAAASARAQNQVQQQIQNQIQQQAQIQAQQQAQIQAQQQAQRQVQAQIQQQAQAQMQQQVQARLQSTVQQQVQSQIQLQAQVQLQQQVQARLAQSAGSQVQARLHSEMARAAILAQQSAEAGQTNLAASNNSRLHMDSEGNANAANRGNAGINLGLRSSSNTNANTNAGRGTSNMNTQLRGSAGLVADLPIGTTQADVALYDNIFGQFNPLRVNSNSGMRSRTVAQANLPISGRSSVGAQAGSDVRLVAGQENANSRTQINSNGMRGNNQVDLSTRISTAIQQRRTEISLLRDEAIDQGNERKMQTAEQMEIVLNTFVEAQVHARTAARVQANAAMNSASQTDIRARGNAGIRSSGSGQIK